jgi:SAM-dependent methyltransferase
MRRLTKTAQNWIAAFLDPRRLASLVYMPRYIRHWRLFESQSGLRLKLADSHPCLLDWITQTPFDPHTFYQAAWLARKLAPTPPLEHVDIGSDIRMINVLSAFVPTEFLDYRPLQATLSGLRCGSADLMQLNRPDGSIPSLSCLHVIEHVGLGRYGDPVDFSGSAKAAAELSRVLAPGGRLYISAPVGRQRVCFNAHRVFDPKGFTTLFPTLSLVNFSHVDDAGQFYESSTFENACSNEYACGMYVFTKQ